ncbi:hypothetical protein ABW21_db0204687 [Orbilia brochopaga]|nr:hypothetical protein ABW21_db0204687 [Drechslerella brochopaga]
MGCYLSSEALGNEGDSGISYGFSSSGTAYFGVDATPTCFVDFAFNSAYATWTPTVGFTDAVGSTVTHIACSPIIANGAGGSLLCDFPVTRMVGTSFDITVPYAPTTDGNGQPAVRTFISAVFLHEGTPITSPVSTRTVYTGTATVYTTTVTNTVNTVWVDPAPGVCNNVVAPAKDKKKKRAIQTCVQDHELIAYMQKEPSVYSPFCATLTVPPAAEQTYPPALAAYTGSPPIITSACSCAFKSDHKNKHKNKNKAGQQPVPPTKTAQAILRRATYPPKCNGDLVLRALLGNSASASAFCETYTTITPSAGYVYPKYVTPYTTCTARIVSGCSCLKGLSPPSLVPPTCTNPPASPLPVVHDYAGPTASYKSGSTITSTTAATPFTTYTDTYTNVVATSTYGCTQ